MSGHSNSLKLEGVAVPTPSSMEISREKIWSANTGRVESGKMTGDLVAIKHKLVIEWRVLTEAQISEIDSHISKAFFECTFRDPRSNAWKTITVYAGTPTYHVYSYANGLPHYDGITVDLIEQ